MPFYGSMVVRSYSIYLPTCNLALNIKQIKYTVILPSNSKNPDFLNLLSLLLVESSKKAVGEDWKIKTNHLYNLYKKRKIFTDESIWCRVQIYDITKHKTEISKHEKNCIAIAHSIEIMNKNTIRAQIKLPCCSLYFQRREKCLGILGTITKKIYRKRIHSFSNGALPQKRRG